MKRIIAALAAATSTAATLLAGGATAPQANAADHHAQPNLATTVRAGGEDKFGCPLGDVCFISAYEPWDVTNSWYRYGVYNLSGIYGEYGVDNNQTGGAHVDLCIQYNGGECYPGPAAGSYWWGDLTPVNSIRLRP
ncbi:hypothetical protein [Actinomadura rupiterrae]|uniref:hypothetical protein n=1 Tax=Actinomadura rupiterrae TaxID=559627 RepID=UPI0020A55D0C|nr:hypothetical protein [Actinomadura rupiterrae]MCP2339242.1 hypothetical protein [Actinomadura rupiterrae]